MRVTSMMKNTMMLGNIRRNNADILDWQNKLSTGQKISKPSDDPVGIGYQMRYTTELARNEQYLENANTGYGWLSQTDTVLQQGQSILQRLNTLTNQAANGTVTPEVREMIRLEVEQLKEQMIQIGNSTYDGRYIFNGQMTDVKPYSIDNAADDKTDDGRYYLNISPSVAVEVSLTGEKIFGEAGQPENVFALFDRISGYLQTPNQQDQLSLSLSDINKAVEKLSYGLSEVGARMNRFELVQNRIADEKLSLTQLKSHVADVDMADAIIQLQLQQNVLQASLSVSAKILQTTMLDYIR